MRVRLPEFELVRDEARRLVRRGLTRVRTATAPHSPGTEPLVIDHLVSPLRYDVVVRRDFLVHLDDHWDEYCRDPRAFTSAATALPYYVWFRSIAVHHMGVADSGETALARAFERRVRRTARLLESWRLEGFREYQPLTVTVAGPSVVGAKHLSRRTYPIDGCHRLALLSLHGHDVLDPSRYQVRTMHAAPIDNTAVLARALDLDEASLVRFVGRGYDVHDASTADELLTRVASTARDEVASVLAADLPRVRPRRASEEAR